MKDYWGILDEATELAMKDLEFRKRLLEDANKAIKERLNEDLPAKAIFHESDPKHLVFVLPLKANIIQRVEELDEDSLESIAGGKGENSSTSSNPPSFPIMAYACYPQDHDSKKQIYKYEKFN